MSSMLSFHMINECIDIKDLEPVDELPRWCYIKSEYDELISKTIRIVDGVRYVEKEPEQLRNEAIDVFVDSIML